MQLRNQAAGADEQSEQTAELPNRQTPKRRVEATRPRSTKDTKSLNVKRPKIPRNLSLQSSITEAKMADVAPPGVERRDKSTESPAKYAGNEDGERSDDDHRGKIVENSHCVE